MNKKHLIAYPVTAIVAIGIGAAGANGDTTTVAGTSTSTTTITAPAQTVTTTAAAAAPVTKSVTKTVTVAPAPRASFPGDGNYQVGVDIKPGTYVSATPDSGNCYWARLSGTDGFSDLIANNNTAGQSVVTIRSSDKFFETNGCNEWTLR